MINYIIKLSDKEFTYKEFFKPYSNKQLNNKDDSNFFSEDITIDLDNLFDNCVEFINEERILPETPDILLDMIYAFANINYFFVEHPFAYYNFDEYLKYVGLYTELIKQNIYNLKHDLSFLINAYFFDSEDETLNRKLLRLKQKYQIDYQIHYHNKESIKKTIYYLCDFNNINKKELSVNYEIDLRRVDKFISLLKNQKTKDFIKTHGCFCLTKADSVWYFSVSGTSPKYDCFGKHLEHDISQYFKFSKFIYCGLNDNVLSYGDSIINNKLKKYISPIPYSKAKTSFPLERIKEEFKCCERKIFPVISSTKSVLVICKYAPCPRCIPAVQQEKYFKESFIFKSFAYDYSDFLKYFNKEKTKMIHKLQLEIINDI